MIYEFIFDNFRTYKNEATIDFTAKPINLQVQHFISGMKKVKSYQQIIVYCFRWKTLNTVMKFRNIMI